MSKLRTWLLRIGGAVVGVAAFMLGALFSLYPSETTSLLAAWFGLSNITIVSWGIIGVLIGLSVTFIAIVLVIIAEWFGWIANFDAEIVGSNKVHQGQKLQFQAFYKGELRKGLFTCKVSLPDGKPEWWGADDTFIHTEKGDVGTLSGSKRHESTWFHTIPRNFPLGKFKASIMVCEWRIDKPRREKKLVFYVVNRHQSGTFGASGTLDFKDVIDEWHFESVLATCLFL